MREPVVRAAVEKACRMVGFKECIIGRVVLSVDEALANIIKHAYEGDQDQPIKVELRPFRNGDGAGLRVRLRDYGLVVDRSKIKSRDLADVRPGGLGVHIMTDCMDVVEYQPADGGGTLLTMEKRIQLDEEGAES